MSAIKPLSPVSDAQAGHAIPPSAPAEPWLATLLSLATGLALLALLLFLLSPLAPPAPDLEDVRKVIAIDPAENGFSFYRPEPLERFLYISGVLLLPFCLGAAYLAVRRLLRGGQADSALRHLRPAAVLFTAAAALALLLAGGLAEHRPALRFFLPGGWYSLTIALALALVASTSVARRIAERAGKLPWALSTGAIGIILFGTLAMAVFREEHVRNIPIFWTSFNAVFHSVVQVFFGRELTVDFVNQYGLYPHFLEPIFRLVGLSVLTFTLLMGLLNCLTFAGIYLFLARETRSPLVACIGTASAFFFCYAYAKANPQPDLFFQYNPLRTIFPAILLVVAQALAHKQRPWMPGALGSLGAAAVLWTPDVGMIVLASGLLFLGYNSLSQRRARQIPWQLLQASGAALAVLILFALLLRLQFGAFPDYTRLFQHAKAFYFLGNTMLPMPRFGLWVPVLAIYTIGLLRALIPLLDGRSQPRDQLSFLLSVLGLGLFTYYQGRSVVWNLTIAAYPAVLLLALFADDLRRAAPGAGQRAERSLLVILLAMFFFSVPALAIITPGWVRNVAGKIEISRRGESTDVLRDIRFLQGLVRPGEKVHIMSYQSGLFHLMTRTTSPLDIPGESEMVYLADFVKESDYAYRRRGKVVVDKITMNAPFVSSIRGFYPNLVENPAGNLMVLQVP